MTAASPGRINDLSPLQSPEIISKRGGEFRSPRSKRRRCGSSPLSTRPTTAESDAAFADAYADAYDGGAFDSGSLFPNGGNGGFWPWPPAAPPPAVHFSWESGRSYTPPQRARGPMRQPPQQQQQPQPQHPPPVFAGKRKIRNFSQGTYAQQARAACRISSSGPMLPANGPIVARCVQPRSDAERHAKLLAQQQRWTTTDRAPASASASAAANTTTSAWPPAPAPSNFEMAAPPSSSSSSGTTSTTHLSEGPPERLPRSANARAAISAYPYPPVPAHRLPKLKHSRQQSLFMEYLRLVSDPMRVQLGHFLIEHCLRSVPEDLLQPESQPDASVIVEYAEQIITAVNIFGQETRFGASSQDAIPSDINEAYIFNWLQQNQNILQPLQNIVQQFRGGADKRQGGAGAAGSATANSTYNASAGRRNRSRASLSSDGSQQNVAANLQGVPGGIHCENLPAVIAHAGLLVRLPHQAYTLCRGGCARCLQQQQQRQQPQQQQQQQQQQPSQQSQQSQQHLLFNLLIAGRGDTRRCKMQLPWGDTVYIKYNRTLLGIPDFVVNCLGLGVSGGAHFIPKVCAVSLEEIPAGLEILLFYRGLPCVKRKLQSVPRYLPPAAEDWQRQQQQQQQQQQQLAAARPLGGCYAAAPAASLDPFGMMYGGGWQQQPQQPPLPLPRDWASPQPLLYSDPGPSSSEWRSAPATPPPPLPPDEEEENALPPWLEEQDVSQLYQLPEGDAAEQQAAVSNFTERILLGLHSPLISVASSPETPPLDAAEYFSAVNSPDSLGLPATDAAAAMATAVAATHSLWAVQVPSP